jgi:hypothetical protein
LLPYIKDDGYNLQTCASAFIFVVSCKFLASLQPFDDSYLGHPLSKVCQYAIENEKVVTRLPFAFIKAIQFVIQKCITWPKKSSKGKQAWEKTCIESGLRPRKFNTLMKIRYIFLSLFVYFLVFWNSSSVGFRGLMCFLFLWFQSQICQLNFVVPRCANFFRMPLCYVIADKSMAI